MLRIILFVPSPIQLIVWVTSGIKSSAWRKFFVEKSFSLMFLSLSVGCFIVRLAVYVNRGSSCRFLARQIYRHTLFSWLQSLELLGRDGIRGTLCKSYESRILGLIQKVSLILSILTLSLSQYLDHIQWLILKSMISRSKDHYDTWWGWCTVSPL